MKFLERLGVLSLLAAGVLAPDPARANLSGFDSQSSFLAAISGLTGAQTVNFDSDAAGTTFASGTGTGGLTFTYSIAGPSTLQVSDTFATTSGQNYLGLDNPDTAFYLGDSVTIDFGRTVHAVGLYLIAGRDAQAGDMELSVAGGSVFNSATADATVSDGGMAFYLGLIESDPALGFSSVTVHFTSTPGAFLAISADDITSAGGPVVGVVPEPGTWLLTLAGLCTLAAAHRRRR